MFDLEWMKGLNLADGIEALKPAAYFAISVGVFSFAIFHLHRFMSKSDFFLIDVSPLRKSGRLLRILLFCVIYLFRYTLLLPMVTYLWFWILVAIVAFLYNSREPREVLLMAMAVLTAVRVTSYYNEDLARDISKILPYGLLGIFLVNLGQINLETSFALMGRIGSEMANAFYYWAYVTCQELILRISYPYVRGINGFIVTTVDAQRKRLVDRGRKETPSTAKPADD